MGGCSGWCVNRQTDKHTHKQTNKQRDTTVYRVGPQLEIFLWELHCLPIMEELEGAFVVYFPVPTIIDGEVMGCTHMSHVWGGQCVNGLSRPIF